MSRPLLRLALALSIGALSGYLCLAVRMVAGGGAWDLSWSLRGAELLTAGQNPYHDAEPPMGLPLFYPLPTVIAVLPLILLDETHASVLFSGLSSAVLAWAVLRERPAAWPVFLSAPFATAVIWSQWTPLILAAAFIPALLPLAILKPNVGLSVFMMRWPRPVSLLIIAVVLAISLLLLPSWLLDWLHNTRSHDSHMPLTTMPGLLLPLALLRWRDTRARLLLGLACVPMRFYDALLLWAIPEKASHGLALSALSWIVFLPWLSAWHVPLAQPSQEAVVGLLFLPALAMLLYGSVQRNQCTTIL